MGKKIFRSRLSVNGINKITQQLEEYQKQLTKKCMLLVEKLGEQGITVAESNTGGFRKYLFFTLKTNPEDDGCKAVLLATNTGMIKSEWRTAEGDRSADVSPLFLIEFGSGLLAENPRNIPGGGTGTFPGQTHAEDPGGWWWMDLEGEWHHSSGMKPLAPMNKAWEKMEADLIKIAKEVFG